MSARLAAPTRRTRVAGAALAAVALLGSAACSGEEPGEDELQDNRPANSEQDEEGGEGGDD